MEVLQERPPYVSFEKRAVEDRAASIEAGHYVAKDIDICFITPAGSKDRIERVASEWLEQIRQQAGEGRFPQEWVRHYSEVYRAWCENQEIPENGTSVKSWSIASPAQVQMLLQLNLRTVEDVAAANEETIARIGMGGRALKQQAQSWLSSSNDVGKVAQENTALRVAVEDLTARNKELEARLAKLEAAENAKGAKKL